MLPVGKKKSILPAPILAHDCPPQRRQWEQQKRGLCPVTTFRTPPRDGTQGHLEVKLQQSLGTTVFSFLASLVEEGNRRKAGWQGDRGYHRSEKAVSPSLTESQPHWDSGTFLLGHRKLKTKMNE